MKKMLVAICLLCIMITAVYAQLSWSEPITLDEYANYGFFGSVIRTTEGNRILLYSVYENGVNNCYMQAFNQENQALWTAPVALEGKLESNYIILTDQNEIATFIVKPYNSNYALYLTKYNLNGVQVGAPNIPVIYNYASAARVYSDRQGGIHVFGFNDNNFDWKYQHILADGSREYSLEGVYIPGIDYGSTLRDMTVRNDGNLLISYNNPTASGVFLMDSGLNVLFSHEFPSMRYEGKCALRSDDGFYIAFTSGWGFKLFAYDSNGQSLWPEPITSADHVSCDKIACDSQDRLITTVTTMNYSYYVQLYDSAGNSLYGGNGALLFGNNTGGFFQIIFADGAEGFYLLRRRTLGTDPSILRYVNTADGSSTWELPLENLNNDQGYSTFYSWVDEGLFNIYYIDRTDQTSGILFNRINPSAEQDYPNPGQEVLAGSSGRITSPLISSLGANRAIAIWAVTVQDDPLRKTLKYNLIEPDIGLVYEEDLYLESFPQDIRDFTCFSTDDGNALVVWVVGGTCIYAQLINPDGAMLWPTRKTLISGVSNAGLYASYYQGSLYLCYPGSGDTIRMQRYIDGEPLWTSLGMVVASSSQGYPGLHPRLEYLIDRTVFWSVRDNATYPRMCYCNSLDENGLNLPGFSSGGLPINTLLEPYIGFKINGVRRGGDRLWLELAMARTQENHSGVPLGVVFDTVIQAIIDNGQIGFPSGGISTRPVCGSFADETGYYLCWEQPANKLMIAKYDVLGNLLWAQSPLNDLNWLLDTSYGISLQKVSEDEFLASGVTLNGSSGQYTYFSFTPDGEITVPSDAIFDISSDYTLKAELTHTGLGTYFLMYNTNGTYAGLQYRASGSGLGSSDEDSPSCKMVSAYPNPFGGSLKLELELGAPGYARLEIYNIRGQRVLKREYQELESGKNELLWDGRDDTSRECASGIYFVRITDGKHSDTIKALRIK